VVVKNGVVLAVEGFEGTDKCLARGGELAGRDGGAVAVKVAREKHDMRFDIPCLGPQTLQTCAAAKISVLALESGRTLLLEPELCEAAGQKK
jgi:UDP-2,3-diacylglucosamine hydrolase